MRILNLIFTTIMAAGMPILAHAQLKFSNVNAYSEITTFNPGENDTLRCSLKYTNTGEDIKIVRVICPRPYIKIMYPKVISKGEGTLDIAAAQKDFVHIPITGSRIGISVYTSNKQRIRIFANFKYTTQLVEKNAEATKDLNEKVYAGSRLESDGDITGALYWYNLVANEQMPMGTSISDKNKRDAIITARKALGDLYSKGEGVGKDEGKARYWYDKANEYERLSDSE